MIICDELIEKSFSIQIVIESQLLSSDGIISYYLHLPNDRRIAMKSWFNILIYTAVCMHRNSNFLTKIKKKIVSQFLSWKSLGLFAFKCCFFLCGIDSVYFSVNKSKIQINVISSPKTSFIPMQKHHSIVE